MRKRWWFLGVLLGAPVLAVAVLVALVPGSSDVWAKMDVSPRGRHYSAPATLACLRREAKRLAPSDAYQIRYLPTKPALLADWQSRIDLALLATAPAQTGFVWIYFEPSVDQAIKLYHDRYLPADLDKLFDERRGNVIVQRTTNDTTPWHFRIVDACLPKPVA